MTITELGVIASLALNIGIALVGATWGISKIETAVRKAIDEHREKYDQDLNELGRNFGETSAALRQKVHEVETWARDTFVRRDSFLAMVTEVRSSVDALGARIEKRLERMETKIDNQG
jgi:uncharacterized coiled-coil DUF342 family protein